MLNTGFLSFYDFMKSKNFNHIFYQYNHYLSAKQYEVPINISEKYIKECNDVLDWSCGNGHFSFYLGYKKAQVTSTSFYDAIHENLKNESFFSLKLIDKKENIHLPFDDASFDSVFSIGVLEHVHETGGDQLLSLKEIRRILRNEGYFLCFHLPYKYSWVENIGRLIPKSLRQKLPIGHPHSKRFDKKTIEIMLEQAGLSLIDYGLYNFLPRNFTRVLPSFLKDNQIFIKSFDGFDKFLTTILPVLCSQSYFVARKSI